MVAATGHRAKFVGVCIDIPVEIGVIVTPMHVLVVEHSDFDLIVGRPFERRSRMRTVNNDDVSLATQIFSADGNVSITIQSATAAHPQILAAWVGNRRSGKRTAGASSRIRTIRALLDSKVLDTSQGNAFD